MNDASQALGASAAEATFGLVLVLSSLALVPLLAALARRLLPGRRVFFARWGFSHLALAVGFYLALMLCGAGALALAKVDLGHDVLDALVFELGIEGAVVLLVIGFARKLDPAGARSLGFWPGDRARSIAIGSLGYAAVAPGIYGSTLLWSWLLGRVGVEGAPQQVIELAAGLTGARALLFASLATLVAPLCEEILFRGFLQPLLVQNLGDRAGVVLTALLFAGLHGNLLAFVPIFALALLLGWVMLRTQRLEAAWFVHALHNGLQVALLFLGPHLRPELGG